MDCTCKKNLNERISKKLTFTGNVSSTSGDFTEYIPNFEAAGTGFLAEAKISGISADLYENIDPIISYLADGTEVESDPDATTKIDLSNKNWLTETDIIAFDDVFAHIASKMKETVDSGSEIQKMIVTFAGTTKSESVFEIVL